MKNQSSLQSISSIFLTPKVNYKHLADLSLGLLVVLLVALSSSIGRPIWIDEFLHFAFASYQPSEVWGVIQNSILGVNHGQTGVYLLIDYWLLHIFGASAFWLRFPSIMSGLIMYFATIYLFRVWKMPFIWQLIGILILFCQGQLTYFIGEARPYMPLASAVVCTLAYYSTYSKQRSRFLIKLFGLFSVLMGVSFHPYYSVYWVTMIFCTYLKFVIEDGEKVSMKSFVSHLNLPLFLTGLYVYFWLGLMTWLRGHPNFPFSFDPFQWVTRDKLVYTFTFSHFQFIEFFQAYFVPYFIALVFFLIITIFTARFRYDFLNFTLFPVIFISVSLFLSIFLSLVSFLNNYWILPRQWVASIALVPLGFTLLSFRVSIVLDKFHTFFKLLWLSIIFIPVFLKFINVGNTEIKALRDRLTSLHPSQNFVLPSNPEFQDYFSYHQTLKPPTIDDYNNFWVALANENIKRGGQVWKGFRGYYNKLVKPL